MKRREVISLLGGVVALWPLAAGAQQGERIRRVGLLTHFSESDPEVQGRVNEFRNALREWAGCKEKIRIDYRYSAGDINHLRTFAAELTALTPDALHSIGSPPH